MSATPPIVMRPQGLPDTKRSRIPASTMLLREWIAARYPGIQAYPELRLGPTPQAPLGVTLTAAQAAMVESANWYADAVIPLPTELAVVEAKVLPNPSAVGQALWYSRLIPATAALRAYLGLPIQPVVLFGLVNAELASWAQALGVRTEVYSPTWLAEYLERINSRKRSGASGNALEGAPEAEA